MSLSETWTVPGETQDVYEIKSVQLEIGVMEDLDEDENSTTSVPPVTKDKLSETKIAFLVPPASLRNAAQASNTTGSG
ncbi:hypothetical protein C0J52_13257 [Blattella germanica]|nr:hypothetical protein C0J52_13257 [Blattella germanica]